MMPARRPKARHTHRGTHTHRPASARIAIHPPRARCVGQSLAWQWCTRVIHTCVAGLKPRRRRSRAAMARAHPSRKGGDVQRAVAVARPVAGPEGGAVTHRARLRALRRGLAARGARRRRPRRSALRRGGARWLRGARARRAWRAPWARGAPRGGLRAGPSPPERGVQAARRRGGVTGDQFRRKRISRADHVQSVRQSQLTKKQGRRMKSGRCCRPSPPERRGVARTHHVTHAREHAARGLARVTATNGGAFGPRSKNYLTTTSPSPSAPPPRPACRGCPPPGGT